MTSTSFDIVLSKLLSPGDVAAALTDLVPNGCGIDVGRDVADLPTEPGAIWAIVGASDDPAWPCIVNVLVCRDECRLTPFPDLRIAVHLRERFGTDALCGTQPFVGELDPLDPYWSLAYVGGSWHLASTVGTPLMGPYSDGPGQAPVRLLRPIEVPAFA